MQNRDWMSAIFVTDLVEGIWSAQDVRREPELRCRGG